MKIYFRAQTLIFTNTDILQQLKVDKLNIQLYFRKVIFYKFIQDRKY